MRMGTAELGRKRVLIFALVGICVLAFTSASAPAAPPNYDGVMGFAAIHGPSDPEDYSWTVTLGEDQTLELVDDQHAQVLYGDGHSAFGIAAEPAHDAGGATVPTTLAISGGDIITLTVHHRSGNPASSGAPFDYPITAGPGWEGGFHTEIVRGPPDETELREQRERAEREEREREVASENTVAARTCSVPKLDGMTLRHSARRLKNAGCAIGQVRRRTGGVGRVHVVGQSPRPGRVVVAGGTVSVTLGH